MPAHGRISSASLYSVRQSVVVTACSDFHVRVCVPNGIFKKKTCTNVPYFSCMKAVFSSERDVEWQVELFAKITKVFYGIHVASTVQLTV